MNWLAQNWSKASLAIVLAVGIALPALAAYEKTGVFTPPDHHVKLGDNSALRFGDGGGGYSDPTTYDVTARWDGTDLDFLANANNTVIKWGNGTNSFDQWLYGSSTSLYLLWDASANDLIFQDSVSAIFGTGLDAELRWDGTDLDLLALADDQVFKFGNGTNSWDLWIYGNVAGDYLLWDASASSLTAVGAATIRPFTAIADPGNAGAIPVTVTGYCPIVTAAAETRTLAAPSFIGQELLLYMKTDGGDAVVTCSTTFNETGNNTATFGDTGDGLRLSAVEEGANLRWRCAVADGVALTTV